MFTEADARLARIASKTHSVFRLADARCAELTPRQIRWRREHAWVELYEGVFRVPGAVATHEGDLLAACWAASPPAAVSRRAAAAIFGLPGQRNDLVEINCRRWLRLHHSGLIVHESTRFDDIDITEVNGIPVCIPERVILELAGWKPNPNYVEAVIHAARRQRLVTYDSTIAVFNRLARRGLRGVRAMRIALDRWNPDNRASDSEMETLLLQILREHGLPEPVLQFELHDEHGQFIARTDAALTQWKITVEYDSKQEHTDEFQIARDAKRRDEIMAAGWWPLTARHGDLKQGGDDLVRRIRKIARRQAS